MKIVDELYGEFEVNEDVYIELINSGEMQRLKKISMAGPPQKYWHTKNFSRYDHSIGVFLLLRKLNATNEEQIAGLLHDISHTAFSHVIDWVFGNPEKEDYQDNIHHEFILNSSIPKILKKYDFDFRHISEFENFKLLDREIPNLCADRLDYSLREIKEIIGIEKTREIIDDLIVINNKIFFKNPELAKVFSENYLKRQKENWGAEKSRKIFFIFSEIFKYALENKLILKDDFFKDSDYLTYKLENLNDSFINERLEWILENKFDNLEGFEMKTKIRFVDANLFLDDEEKRVSDLFDEFRIKLEEVKNE